VDGKRYCTGMVLVQSHQPRFCPLAPSRHGSLVGVADALHMDTVQLYAEIPFGAPAVWITAIMLTNATTPGVLSARWHALSCVLCPSMALCIVMLQIVWIQRVLCLPPRRFSMLLGVGCSWPCWLRG
jgi:hypothetical protein